MLILKSPAKINLFLKIIGKRLDGYHELASLFQAVDLHDILSFQFADSDLLECSSTNFPTDRSNLIWKAVDLYKKKSGHDFKLHVKVDKHIPVEAGLGGGSSNAATTLWAINSLFGFPVPESDLMRWAAEIGSDLSFFFSSGTAYCTGRGEIVQSLNPFDLRDVWICKPAMGLATPQVYKNLDLADLHPHCPQETLQEFINGQPNYYNDLEKPALALLPELNSFKQSLLDQGFKTVMLSGSGSSFICLGAEPKTSLGIFSCKASFINRSLDGWY